MSSLVWKMNVGGVSLVTASSPDNLLASSVGFVSEQIALRSLVGPRRGHRDHWVSEHREIGPARARSMASLAVALTASDQCSPSSRDGRRRKIPMMPIREGSIRQSAACERSGSDRALRVTELDRDGDSGDRDGSAARTPPCRAN